MSNKQVSRNITDDISGREKELDSLSSSDSQDTESLTSLDFKKGN